MHGVAGPAIVIDPRREAFDRLDGRYDTRVLEPSPPAVHDPPWFADDPVAPDERTALPLVSPVPDGDVTWDELARDDTELAAWCAERWLGAWPRLRPIDDRAAFERTCVAWHVLAEHALAPARHAASGRIGLRCTRGGFGTPFFGADEQVRVRGDQLAVIRGGDVVLAPVTTLRDAAALTGGPLGLPAGVYEPATALEPDGRLAVDPGAAAVLAGWFGFTCSVLEHLRAAVAHADPSRVQLWPEHFDLSFDLGDEHGGTRGTFGASPADAGHDDPYLYVTHWSEVPGDPYWNDPTFDGASLPYVVLVAADDPRRVALDFFARGRAVLGA